METRIDEIAEGIYRLSTFVPGIAPPAQGSGTGRLISHPCAEQLVQQLNPTDTENELVVSP